jgi:hypothetical protein
MLAFLRDRVSDRKLRLFACACCRSIWDLMTDERSRNAVEEIERLADGTSSVEEILVARISASDALDVAIADAERRSDGTLSDASGVAVHASHAALTLFPMYGGLETTRRHAILASFRELRSA